MKCVDVTVFVEVANNALFLNETRVSKRLTLVWSIRVSGLFVIGTDDDDRQAPHGNE